MTPTLFFSFIIATFVTMILIPPLVRAAERFHVLDLPSPRKVHNLPVPRVGGVAMAIGALLPMLIWLPRGNEFNAYLAGICIIVAFGVWDDLRRLDYRIKLFGQLVAVLIVVFYGGIVIRHVPFLGVDPLPDFIAIPLAIIVLVGVTNAINLADGLDGLAGGITLLSLGLMAVLAHTAGDEWVLLASAAVIGSTVGFLRFNTYPARIFMGDGGSQFLGFSAGVLVTALSQQDATATSPVLPLMILGLPILDTVMVMSERIMGGRSPFSADRNHIHHKLLTLGFGHYEAVFAIYLLQAALVLAAYLLRFESDILIIGSYIAFCAALLAMLRAAGKRGWRLHGSRHAAVKQENPRWITWLRKEQRLLRFAFHFAIIAIPGYFFLGAFFVERVPQDIGVLAWLMFAVLVVLFFRHHHKPFNIVERACVYVAGICIVYLVQMMPGRLAHFDLARNILFVGMTLAVVIGIRFSQERFRVTPMDFLVVFIALVAPNLPDVKVHAQNVGMGIAMLIVLFYGIELVLNNIWRRWDFIRLTTCVTLAVLGVRGLATVFV
jgi:UDP-GlcNAc:undecaprenyl-phosphate GlcNAc-1-phosphate transferase